MCSENYELNAICRICLSEETNLINIFSSTSNIPLISKAIMECAPVLISETDILPHTICTRCLDILETVHNFRTLCLQSDKTLRNNVFYTAVVKQENDYKLEIIPIIEFPSIQNEFSIEYVKEKPFDELPLDHSRQSPENDIKDIKFLQEYATNDSTSVYTANLIEPTVKEEPEKPTPEAYSLAPNEDGYFCCELCDKKYTRKETLKEHLRIHSGFRYHCDQCDKYFDHRLKLSRHKHKHDTERKYNCEICGLLCLSLENLRHHQQIHTDKREHKCKICKKQFALKKYLDHHLIIHKDERPYVCEICGKGFKRSDHLTCHKQIHSTKRFKCPKCPMTFVYKQNLKKHIKRCS